MAKSKAPKAAKPPKPVEKTAERKPSETKAENKPTERKTLPLDVVANLIHDIKIG